MKYIFNINKTGSPSKDDNPWYPCKYFGDFINDHPLPKGLRELDLNLYNVRRDTHKGSVESLLKYDLPDEEPVVDIPTFRAALGDVKRDYSFMEGKGKIRKPGDLMVNPDGSSGVVFKELGLDYRVDVISQEPGMLEWFWDYAHLVQYPTLWKGFGKTELLKIDKVIRNITNPPVDFHMASASMNQHTNELASEYGARVTEQPFGPGMSLQGGGLNRYVEWLDVGKGKNTSSDVDKYDASFKRILFQGIKELRFFFWDKEGMSEDEWWDRQNYYYREKIYTHLVSSNGQVFMKMSGNSSGQDSTTYDNTWGHNIMKYYNARVQCGIGADPNGYAILKRYYKFKLYGDDNNEKILEPYDKFFTYEQREAAYARWGFKLSRADRKSVV